MRAWWLVALVLLLIPSAEASVELTMGAVIMAGNPIKPEVGRGTLTVPVTYSCSGADAAVSGGVLTISFSEVPTGVDIQGPLHVLFPDTACHGPASTAWTKELRYNVTATRQVPGLKLLSFTVEARVEGGAPSSPPAASTKASGQVVLDYFAYIAATVNKTIVQVAPGESVDFDVLVTNFGNAGTDAVFTVAGTPANGWGIEVPPAAVLGSPSNPDGQDVQHAKVTVRAPHHDGWNNEQQAFTVTVTPHASLDRSKTGTPVSVAVLARVRGCYPAGSPCTPLTSPTPAAPLVAAALLACALIARRRA